MFICKEHRELSIGMTTGYEAAWSLATRARLAERRRDVHNCFSGHKLTIFFATSKVYSI